MKRYLMAVGMLTAIMLNGIGFASSPLPQFEKEAIDDTYRRTGEMEPVIDNKYNGLSKEHLGNTGTKEHPTFYIKKIKLTGDPIEDKFGELQAILKSYENKHMDIAMMRELQDKVTKFGHDRGYTVCWALIPPQRIKNGELEVKLYISRYDKITRIANTSKVADRVLDRYVSQIKPGQMIRDVRLEKTLNRLNDLPGVQAKAILQPGSEAGTTSLDIDIQRRPVWNNYIFADNGGTKSTGRYRYGFYTEYNNPGNQGDKIGLSGMTSNGDLWGGSVKYETPVGYRGTRMGIVASLTDYDAVDVLTNNYRDSKGRSEGISYYGYTPIYRDKRSRVHAAWGYDHRRLRDKYTGDFKRQMEELDRLFGIFNLPGGSIQENKRHSNVMHVGVNGSEYEKNRFTQYDATWWWGNVTCDQNIFGGSTSDNEGSFHKGTAHFTHILFDGKTNYRINMSAQIANRNLDSSETFYIGGMNSVRAYNGSSYAGDNGIYWCGEIRRNIGIKGLEAAAFFEGADASYKFMQGAHRTLQGWGLGLRYRKDNDWHVQVDYGRKFRRETDESSMKNDSAMGHWWFQAYKMF